MPGKKRVGSFRLPESRPDDKKSGDRKSSSGDARPELVRRAKRYLRGVAGGSRTVSDPDSEVRQAPRSTDGSATLRQSSMQRPLFEDDD